MKRLIHALAALFFSACAADAQDVTGDWEGTTVRNGQSSRLVFEIRKDPKGALSVHVLTPNGTIKLAESASLDGPNIKFAISAVFECRYDPATDTIEGVVTRLGDPAPIVLHRLEPGAIQRERRKVQYRFQDVVIPIPSGEEPRIAVFSPKPALDYIEQGAIAWDGERQCISCHTTGTYMQIRPQLTAAFGAPKTALRDSFIDTLKKRMAVDVSKLQTGLVPAEAVQIAAGLAQWDAQVLHRLSPETEDALAHMFRLQLANGSWRNQEDTPPFESSSYQVATVAARAVGTAPGWLAKQRGTPMEANINRLANYLRSQPPKQGDYDRAALLWAALEMPGLLEESRKQELIQMLFAHQEADGGWSMRSMAKPEVWVRGNNVKRLAAQADTVQHFSDGHMTGMAIILLREAGIPASDARIQRGVQWLLTNQRSSGRWWTRSLNSDNLHFINYSGTAYPLLALELCGQFPRQGEKTMATGR